MDVRCVLRASSDPFAHGFASAPVREKVVSTASASHEVKQGDTMYSIAKRYGVTQEAILAANGMKNHNISLGQQLRIPGKGAAVASQSAKKAPVASSVRPVVASVSSVPVSRPVAEAKATNKIVQYTVQNGDTLWAIARKFNVSVELLSLSNMSGIRTAPQRHGPRCGQLNRRAKIRPAKRAAVFPGIALAVLLIGRGWPCAGWHLRLKPSRADRCLYAERLHGGFLVCSVAVLICLAVPASC
ncbi:MAG: LysM peptidoglycan-binding domain-containing protein [Bilophila wadsworthia]